MRPIQKGARTLLACDHTTRRWNFTWTVTGGGAIRVAGFNGSTGRTEIQPPSRSHARWNLPDRPTQQGSRTPTLLACYRTIPSSGSLAAAWSGGAPSVASSDGGIKDGTETQPPSKTHARRNSQWQPTLQGSRAPTLLPYDPKLKFSGSGMERRCHPCIQFQRLHKGQDRDSASLEKTRHKELTMAANAAGDPCANPACLLPYDSKVSFTGSGIERRCDTCKQFRRKHKGRDRDSGTIENTRQRELATAANAAGEPYDNPACLKPYDPKLKLPRRRGREAMPYMSQTSVEIPWDQARSLAAFVVSYSLDILAFFLQSTSDLIS
jgi:hypothetical protein